MVALGLLVAALVAAYPERLRAPAWVAYTACGTFVFGGLARLAFDAGRSRLYHGFVVMLLATMAAVPAWIAVGPGSRAQCRIGGLGAGVLPPELACRAGFCVAALLVGGMLAVAIRSRPMPPREP